MEQKRKYGWQPGQSGNPAGRPKGSKNKFTKEVRQEIMRVVGKTMKSLQDDMESMSPKDRVAAATAFLKYFLATTKNSNKTIKGEVKIDVNWENQEPKKD